MLLFGVDIMDDCMENQFGILSCNVIYWIVNGERRMREVDRTVKKKIQIRSAFYTQTEIQSLIGDRSPFTIYPTKFYWMNRKFK